MTVATTVSGIPQHTDIEGAIPPSSRESIDEALALLTSMKDEWAALPIPDRRAILGEVDGHLVRTLDQQETPAAVQRVDRLRDRPGVGEQIGVEGRSGIRE